MSLDDYLTTSEVAAELRISASEVEHERRLFGIKVAKKGGCRWWDADQVDVLKHRREHYYGGCCPDCRNPLPWPAPKPRKARKPAVVDVLRSSDPEGKNISFAVHEDDGAVTEGGEA